MHLEETLLDKVLGVFRSPGCPHHKGEDIPTMTSVEFEKCTVVSMGGLVG